MYGVIDMGSNTIRLIVYRCKNGRFRSLFSEKAMVGLAGYVQDEKLSLEGIERAGDALLHFRDILANMDIQETHVFATASLRNVSNTQTAIEMLEQRTGYTIELISGEEEARLDFIGAMHNVKLDHGLLTDIGGGSTELVSYQDRQILQAVSVPIGSLGMYTRYVKKILPREKERKEMKKAIVKQLDKVSLQLPQDDAGILCGVGGTVRAALKLTNYMFSQPSDCNVITADRLRFVLDTLSGNDATAWSLILKACPERIHTIVPGLCILREVVKKYGCEFVVVSRYGVREGYLVDRVLKKGGEDEEK